MDQRSSVITTGPNTRPLKLTPITFSAALRLLALCDHDWPKHSAIETFCAFLKLTNHCERDHDWPKHSAIETYALINQIVKPSVGDHDWPKHSAIETETLRKYVGVNRYTK